MELKQRWMFDKRYFKLLDDSGMVELMSTMAVTAGPAYRMPFCLKYAVSFRKTYALDRNTTTN